MRDHPTINEAIAAVMRDAGVPLTAKEAYGRIIEQKLYEFHAQHPINVVSVQIRRHCRDLDFPTAAPRKYFGMTPDGKFYPLDTPIETKSPSGMYCRNRGRT